MASVARSTGRDFSSVYAGAFARHQLQRHAMKIGLSCLSSLRPLRRKILLGALLAVPVLDKEHVMQGIVVINDVVYSLLQRRRGRI